MTKLHVDDADYLRTWARKLSKCGKRELRVAYQGYREAASDRSRSGEDRTFARRRMLALGRYL